MLSACMVWLWSATSVFAATLYFADSGVRVNKGDEFIVRVIVAVDDPMPINAVSGIISYSNNIIGARVIRDGESFVPLWLEQPEIREHGKAAEHISFAGVIPGGFRGLLRPFSGKTEAGTLFSIIFEAKDVGEARIYADEIDILLHDGSGTSAEVTIEPHSFPVYPAVDNAARITEEDTTPPTELFAEIASDSTIFGGQWFVAFYTTDKESGISYFEVKEGDGDYVRAESPYLLSDQTRATKVFVKAVDRAGNIRVQEIAPSYPLISYKHLDAWAIISVLVLFWLYFYFRKKRAK